MSRAAKRAEIIRAAYLDYHAGRIDLGALLAVINSMRDNRKRL